MVLEKQLLPSVELKPAYDKVVWLYVYRDFSQQGADAKADRISLRIGVSSWPQLVLLDPSTVRVIGNTGRTVKSFLQTVKSVAPKVRSTKDLAAADRIKRADGLAEEIENTQSVGLARRHFADQDIVVRFRALQVLAKSDPGFVAKAAATLLKVPNDSYRYEVCSVLRQAGDANAGKALEALARNPAPSRNPNVLRIKAVAALSTCGGPSSIEVIEPFTKGSYLNMLTKTAIDSVAAIGVREPKSKRQVSNLLIDAFPKPLQSTTVHVRYCTLVAKAVHDALQRVNGVKLPFPKSYDKSNREALIRAWRANLAEGHASP